MKKKLTIFMFAVLGASTFTSCVDLDSDKYFEDRKTLKTVFTDKQQSEEWLAYAYKWLGYCNTEVGSKADDFYQCFDDCMYYGDRDNQLFTGGVSSQLSYNQYRMGLYGENFNNNSWRDCYRGINQATTFIYNIDMNTDMTEKERLDYKGQARFVRAYYYWLLLRKYGPVPILPDEGLDYNKSYEELSLPRNTYEEVAEYIGKEMLQAAQEIQYKKRDAQNQARPTKGACLATRALAYIYAASPLANGQLKNGNYHDPSKVSDAIAQKFKNFDGKQLLSTEYDEKKWARAAAACRDVIGLGSYELYHVGRVTSGVPGNPVTITPPDDDNFSRKVWPYGWKDIDPQKSYANMFNGMVSAYDNPELIFGRVNMMTGKNDYSLESLVLHEMPVSCGGWNTHGMTQKMVDAYYMNDGTDVPGKDSEMNGGNGSKRVTGWTTEENYKQYPPLAVGVSLQYANREPRFYASCGYSGTVWECLNGDQENKRNKQVFYYRGGGDGYINAFSYLRTGIGVRKYYNPKDYAENRSTALADFAKNDQRYEPAIRYADILLMYAEALNELDGSYEIPSWDGSETYTISRDISEIKSAIQPVRIRAGVPDYKDSEYSDKNVLRAKIKRERMIEFFAEGKRYYDLRRWMDAPIEEAEPVYGLNILMTADKKDDFMKIVPAADLQSTFSTKMYFWPVTWEELKRDKNLVQVPGWTYYD